MTPNPSLLRRVYDGAALLALLNVIAFAGLVSVLIGTGTIDGEKARRIVAALRGEEPAATKEVTSDATSEAEAGGLKSASPTPASGESGWTVEIMRREAERIKTELDQRLALNNSILLRVMTEREEFRKEREAVSQREQQTLIQRQNDGFKKQVAIYEGLAPKVAVEHLLAMDSADEAARLLLEMDTRKAKKIVEAAKRGDQMGKMQVILQRVREVAPDRSDELEEAGP